MSIATVPEIIAELKAGRMVVLIDEEDRENEGDLVLAADFVTPEAINFMARFGRGLICLTLHEERCQQLNLPLMVSRNGSSHGTNFTVSIEAAEGVTTGISAHDRAQTIKAAVARNARPRDIVQPGHIFPLMAQKGGVLVRAGHTEAGCDLAALAGASPAAVICEILNDDGTMARLPDLLPFAETHGLKIGTIRDLIEYRSQTETLVEQVATRPVETVSGTFQLHAFRDTATQLIHLALTRGSICTGDEVLVRVHEPLSIADWLDTDSMHSWGMYPALARLAAAESAVLLLLHRPESGQDLLERLFPEQRQSSSQKWDTRTYGIGAQILKHLGVTRMKLLSQPRKMPSMAGFNLEVTGFVTPSHE